LQHYLPQGPYCSLCTTQDEMHYYNSDESACLKCKESVLWPLWAALGAFLTLLGLLGVWWRCKLQTPRRIQAMFRWVWGVYAQLSLGAKIKQLLAFYQVVTRLADVHELQLPTQVPFTIPTRLCSLESWEATGPCPNHIQGITVMTYYAAPQVQQLLEMLDVFSINVGSLGLPLECLGLGGYEDHLRFTIHASESMLNTSWR